MSSERVRGVGGTGEGPEEVESLTTAYALMIASSLA